MHEPLLIRGYFSSKTHPLLAPLVPQLKDLLTEFEVAGHGKVRVEVVDPAKNPEAEDEANNKYGIRPNPFQVADRHQSSLVNSYFDVLVQYGDQFEVLGFRDLIEVKVAGESDLDVQLRNPEYDITRTIKKVLYGFQSGGELFASIPKPLKFVGYVSNDRVLPRDADDVQGNRRQSARRLREGSGGKLSVEFVDPDAGNGAVAKEIREKYGFRPMAASLFDTNTFYFYLTLDGGASTVVQIPLPEDLTEEGLKRSMDAAFKRFATGYLKSVALMAPETPAYMQGMGGGNQYSQLADTLMTDHNVERTQLTEGRVPEGAEVLVVADPQQLNDKQVFAIDQFLMQGGTVMLAASPLAPIVHPTIADRRAAQHRARRLACVPGHRHPSVVRDGPAELGVPDTGDASGRRFLVPGSADARLSVFRRRARCRQERDFADHVRRAAGDDAVGVADRRRCDEEQRPQGGRSAEEFAGELALDVDGRDAAHRFGGSLGVHAGRRSRRIDARRQRRRTVPVVLRRQGESVARRRRRPRSRGRCRQRRSRRQRNPKTAKTDAGVIGSIIDKSPESARLFVFGSNTFLSDQTLGMIGSAEGTVYGNSLQLIANAVDWSLEDPTLLAIRSRGHFNRTLPPLEEVAAHDARILELRHCAGAARTDLRHPPLARENARREVPRVARFQGRRREELRRVERRTGMNRHVKALSLVLAVQLAVLAGVLFWNQRAASTPAGALLQVDRAKVDGIVIVDEKGTKLKLRAPMRVGRCRILEGFRPTARRSVRCSTS